MWVQVAPWPCPSHVPLRAWGCGSCHSPADALLLWTCPPQHAHVHTRGASWDPCQFTRRSLDPCSSVSSGGSPTVTASRGPFPGPLTTERVLFLEVSRPSPPCASAQRAPTGAKWGENNEDPLCTAGHPLPPQRHRSPPQAHVCSRCHPAATGRPPTPAFPCCLPVAAEQSESLRSGVPASASLNGHFNSSHGSNSSCVEMVVVAVEVLSCACHPRHGRLSHCCISVLRPPQQRAAPAA